MGTINDLTGKVFSKLTVIERGENDRFGKTRWWCQCECGNKKLINGASLIKGLTKSCGCGRARGSKAFNFIDETGNVYGKLTVIKQVSRPEDKDNTRAYWLCQCECGNTKIVQGKMLRLGKTRTCGCYCASNGETLINRILTEHNIIFIQDKPYFSDLIVPSGGIGRFDFILLKGDKPYRIIEFDGRQHYEETTFFKNSLEDIKMNDEVKNRYALKQNIPLVRIPYTELNKITYELLMGDKYLVTSNNQNSELENTENMPEDLLEEM